MLLDHGGVDDLADRQHERIWFATLNQLCAEWQQLRPLLLAGAVQRLACVAAQAAEDAGQRAGLNGHSDGHTVQADGSNGGGRVGELSAWVQALTSPPPNTSHKSKKPSEVGLC